MSLCTFAISGYPNSRCTRRKHTSCHSLAHPALYPKQIQYKMKQRREHKNCLYTLLCCRCNHPTRVEETLAALLIKPQQHLWLTCLYDLHRHGNAFTKAIICASYIMHLAREYGKLTSHRNLHQPQLYNMVFTVK